MKKKIFQVAVAWCGMQLRMASPWRARTVSPINIVITGFGSAALSPIYSGAEQDLAQIKKAAHVPAQVIPPCCHSPPLSLLFLIIFH